MKNKRLLLIIIGIMSLIMGYINFSYDNFIFLSYITVSLIAFFGFWEDIKNIWYHRSAHIIVSGIISVLIGIYEILKYIFGWLAVYTSQENPPIFKIDIFVFSLFMILVMVYEINYLKKAGKNI
ncbi:hypothetical protein XO10_01230 [Marinitoga sp. 1135]|uniref:Uncharacterized protein n=1 Tax=Marinitoga piezophila (strain DSM 14283 / JCM 11233 / KA3) TaxID=443254 RepID=H2J3J5_MARPK|nr:MULTISPECIES: hypothetical protein [Marinitoga]AEX84639.1 hypothetical protein Marpi_0184 [Marinitoga piezophila KA3]APT75156.1 hypothetical protein LN42_01145 [Marinitoga sp. 1137]NUU94930.1 hypothetical protein [Marinitoga sp. 1135]NUU96883.1 hypothetical protein [Marinitoga sp. 1138]